MTVDPDFAVPDPPPQGETSVALSDKTLLAVSLAGFVVLATTVYILVIRPSLSAEELDEREGNHNYDDELDHADVRTLNRAQRRARARNRMKRNRRVDPRTPGQLHQQHEDLDEGADEADVGAAAAQHQLLDVVDEAAAAVPDGNDSSQQHLSRKERARLAKAKEREERKLFEKERQEQRRKAEAAAAVERREREKEREALAQEERRRREAEAHERERVEHREWMLMFSENRNDNDVKDFISKAKLQKIWPIEDISKEYGVSSDQVQARLRQLLADDRMFGVVSNGNFIYLEPDDMKKIAESIKRNGRTSHSELGREICRVAAGTSEQ